MDVLAKKTKSADQVIPVTVLETLIRFKAYMKLQMDASNSRKKPLRMPIPLCNIQDSTCLDIRQASTRSTLMCLLNIHFFTKLVAIQMAANVYIYILYIHNFAMIFCDV